MNFWKHLSLSGWVWFGLTLVVIAVFAILGPAERTLGLRVRIVYLHGAWVWTALAAFVASGVSGLVGLVRQRESWHCWSRALGLTGLVFWVTYLPLSIWTMQSTWNGLFLSEPRWELALVFSISGVMLQVGLYLMGNLRLVSLGNLVYGSLLVYALLRTENIMHPASPILTSDAWLIRMYFFGLLALTLLAAGQIASFFRRLATCRAKI